jgi:hypothetical protein
MPATELPCWVLSLGAAARVVRVLERLVLVFAAAFGGYGHRTGLESAVGLKVLPPLGCFPARMTPVLRRRLSKSPRSPVDKPASEEIRIDLEGLGRMKRQAVAAALRALAALRTLADHLDDSAMGLSVEVDADALRARTVVLIAVAQQIGVAAARVAAHLGEVAAFTDLAAITIPPRSLP